MSEIAERARAPYANYYRERAARCSPQCGQRQRRNANAYLILADQWEGLAIGVEAFLEGVSPMFRRTAVLFALPLFAGLAFSTSAVAAAVAAAADMRTPPGSWCGGTLTRTERPGWHAGNYRNDGPSRMAR